MSETVTLKQFVVRTTAWPTLQVASDDQPNCIETAQGENTSDTRSVASAMDRLDEVVGVSRR